MNWIDIIVVCILIYAIIKGLSLGLVVSMFNIIQVILSVVITKIYYPYISGYIFNNPKIYNVFKRIISKFANSQLILNSLLKLTINIFSMIIMFSLISILISLLLEVFSFILRVPVLKQLNKIGGIIFGLIEGLFIIYLLNILLSPIASIYPSSLIGEGILNSFTSNYLKDMNLMFNILSIKKLIF